MGRASGGWEAEGGGVAEGVGGRPHCSPLGSGLGESVVAACLVQYGGQADGGAVLQGGLAVPHPVARHAAARHGRHGDAVAVEPGGARSLLLALVTRPAQPCRAATHSNSSTGWAAGPGLLTLGCLAGPLGTWRGWEE